MNDPLKRKSDDFSEKNDRGKQSKLSTDTKSTIEEKDDIAHQTLIN